MIAEMKRQQAELSDGEPETSSVEAPDVRDSFAQDYENPIPLTLSKATLGEESKISKKSSKTKHTKTSDSTVSRVSPHKKSQNALLAKKMQKAALERLIQARIKKFKMSITPDVLDDLYQRSFLIRETLSPEKSNLTSRK